MNIKIGDTVKLKSGGPAMTVSYVEEYTGEDNEEYISVSCSWFADDQKEASNDRFSPEMLKKVDLDDIGIA